MRPNAFACGLLAAALVARTVWAAAYGPTPLGDPRTYFAVAPQWHETSTWFAGVLRPGERFAVSYQSLYSTWDAPWPDTDPRWNFWLGSPRQELMRTMQSSDVRKILVDTADAGFQDYADRLAPAADVHGSLSFLDWPRCFADSGTPSRFLVYCRP